MTEGSHAGRPSSWMAVGVMLAGFVLGGLGLVLGPSWPLFWVGVAIAAVGGVLALAVGIFSDVVMYTSRDITYDAGSAPADAVSGAAGTDGAETRTGKTETAPADAPRSDAENVAGG